MKKYVYVLFLLPVIISACNDLEEVGPGDRNTFIKFFGNSNEDLGSQVRQTADGGYIFIGSSLTDSLEYLVLTKTDRNANVLWTRSYPGANGFAVKVLDNGYLIIGDTIREIDASETVTSIFLARTDETGSIINSSSFGDTNEENPRDYHGSALTLDSNNNIYILGTRENESDLEETVVVAFDVNFNVLWSQEYFLQNRSTLVSKNIHINNDNNLIWTSSAFLITEDDSDNDDDNASFDSFFNIPMVGLNAQQVNNDNFGQNSSANYVVSDIMPGAGGFGIIGTYNLNGSNDMLFIRTRSNGSIIEGSEKFFDGESREEGYALSRTNDGGYILLGSIATTNRVGNGGRDILLIKVDSQGNELWRSILGGSGNEIGNSVIQTSDGGYLVFGTQTIQGFSMMMMIKTNSQGLLVEN